MAPSPVPQASELHCVEPPLTTAPDTRCPSGAQAGRPDEDRGSGWLPPLDAQSLPRMPLPAEGGRCALRASARASQGLGCDTWSRAWTWAQVYFPSLTEVHLGGYSHITVSSPPPASLPSTLSAKNNKKSSLM